MTSKRGLSAYDDVFMIRLCPIRFWLIGLWLRGLRLISLSPIKFCLIIILSAQSAFATPLYIYSASSLHLALEPLVKSYQKQSQTPIYLISGSSSLLARQITQGAKADIFISAHKDWLDYVKNATPLYETKKLATNQLVLASAKPLSFAKPLSIESKNLLDLLTLFQKHRLRFALASPSLPLGLYSAQALRSYQLWHKAREGAIIGSSSRQILSWLTRGFVDVAVIYQSDIHFYPHLSILFRFPAFSYEPIDYHMVRLNDTKPNKNLFHFLYQKRDELDGLSQ